MHRAVALDGRQLAVKVQHAGLRESGAADVATIGTAAKALAWAVPDYDYSWVATETAINLPLVRYPLPPPPPPSHTPWPSNGAGSVLDRTAIGLMRSPSMNICSDLKERKLCPSM